MDRIANGPPLEHVSIEQLLCCIWCNIVYEIAHELVKKEKEGKKCEIFALFVLNFGRPVSFMRLLSINVVAFRSVSSFIEEKKIQFFFGNK